MWHWSTRTVDAFHRHTFNISFACSTQKKCRHTHIGIHTDTQTYTYICRHTIRQTGGHTNVQRHTQRQLDMHRHRQKDADRQSRCTNTCWHTYKYMQRDYHGPIYRSTETQRHIWTLRNTQTKERQDRHIITQSKTYTRKHTDTCRPQRDAYKMHKDIHVHRNTGR